jgi:hypothetical protein
MHELINFKIKENITYLKIKEVFKGNFLHPYMIFQITQQKN